MSTIYVAPKAEEEAPGSAEAAPSAEPSQEKPRIEYHEVANLFPMMAECDLAKLAEDIRVNGQHEKIWLHEGKIIDGRNRYEGCKIAGVEPEFRDWDGVGSLVTFVLSLNLHRRHLTDSQRALIAGKAKQGFEAEALKRRKANLVQNKAPSENLVPGSSDSEAHDEAEQQNKTSSENRDPGSSSAKAAKALNVSKDAVEKASRVLKKGDESLIHAFETAKVSLDAASAVAALPKAEQREIVEKGQVKEAAKELQDAKKVLPEKAAEPPSIPVKSTTSPAQLPGSKAVTDIISVIHEYHRVSVAAGKLKTADIRLTVLAKSLRDDIEALRKQPSPTVDSAPTTAPARATATEISNVLRPVADKPQAKSKYDPVLGF